MAEMTLKDWELQREMEEKAKEWLRSVVSPDLAGQRRPVGIPPSQSMGTAMREGAAGLLSDARDYWDEEIAIARGIYDQIATPEAKGYFADTLQKKYGWSPEKLQQLVQGGSIKGIITPSLYATGGAPARSFMRRRNLNASRAGEYASELEPDVPGVGPTLGWITRNIP